jgi:AraC family transcriptional activator of pobA
MNKIKYNGIPNQIKLINSVKNIPIEYFKWGEYPDHFKIDMPHRHEFAELLFFTKGGGMHEINFKNHEIDSASIHYIPKSTVHFLKRDIYSDGFTIAFDTDYLEHNTIHRFINPLKIESLAVSFSKKEFCELRNQAMIIIQRIRQEQGFYKEKCFLLSLDLLLNLIASKCRTGEKQKNETGTSLLREFKYLVKTNIHNHHSFKWYAEQLNVSVKYLGNDVKRKINTSAKNYITQFLLASIKEELINTNKPLSHIAFDYNLESSSLSKLFKKNVGYTMSEYRSGKKVDF